MLTVLELAMSTPTPRMRNTLVFLWMGFLLSLNVSVVSGESVSFYAGVNLTGLQCPGTARLFCDGSNLFFLRWRYNDTTPIHSFSTTDLPSNITLSENPAFLSVELSNVTLNPDDHTIANFSSILTVDLSQLHEENVADIRCGATGVEDNLPINLQIIQPTAPDIPSITTVTATYQFGVLTSITVSLAKPSFECPEFEDSFEFEVYFREFGSIPISQTNCGDTLCEVVISLISVEMNKYQLSIAVRNSIGTSELTFYPTAIGQQSEVYFFPRAVWNSNCQAEVQCVSQTNAICTICYSTNLEQFNQTCANITSLNSTINFPGLFPDTTYFFQFSVVVSDTLLIVETVQLPSTTCDGPLPPQDNIAAIVVPIVTITFIILVAIIIILISVCVCMNKRRNRPTEKKNETAIEDIDTEEMKKDEVLEHLKEEVTALHEEVSTLKRKVSDKDKTIEYLKTAEQEVSTLKRKNKALNHLAEDKQKVEQELSQEKKEKNKVLKDLGTAKEELSGLRQEAFILQQKLADKDKALNDLDIAKQKVEQELSQEKEEKETALEELDTAKQDVRHLQQVVSTLQQKLANKEEDLNHIHRVLSEETLDVLDNHDALDLIRNFSSQSLPSNLRSNVIPLDDLPATSPPEGPEEITL